MNIAAKLAISVVAAFSFSQGSDTFADTDQYEIMAEHANTVFCTADELQDLFRDELRRTKCFPKLIATTAKLKGTSARVRRRARTIKVAQWDREFDRLDSLICELDELLKETYDRSAQGLERPLADCNVALTQAMANMNNGVVCMRAICQSMSEDLVRQSNFQSPYTESFLQQPAPGFQPTPFMNAPADSVPYIPQPAPVLPPPADSALPDLTVPRSILIPDSSMIPDPSSKPKSALVPKPLKRPPTSLIPRPKKRVVPATANMPLGQTLRYAPPSDLAKTAPKATPTKKPSITDSVLSFLKKPNAPNSAKKIGPKAEKGSEPQAKNTDETSKRSVLERKPTSDSGPAINPPIATKTTGK